MVQKIDVSQARNDFASMMNRVYFNGQKFMIMRRGIPMAIVVGINEGEKMNKTDVSGSGENTALKLFGLWKKKKTSTLEIADSLRKRNWENHAH